MTFYEWKDLKDAGGDPNVPCGAPINLLSRTWDAATAAALANTPTHKDAEWIKRGTSPDTYDCEAPFWFYDTIHGVAFVERDEMLHMFKDTITHYIPGDNGGRIPKPPQIQSEAEKAWEGYCKTHHVNPKSSPNFVMNTFIDAFNLGLATREGNEK